MARLLDRCRVVLVETSNPENLGSIARLLRNFGVSSWTLVAPRVTPSDHRALVVGRAAQDLLGVVQSEDRLVDALASATCVVGFSARMGAGRPQIGLRGLSTWLHEHAKCGSLALVFGPEETGLRREHVDLCDLIVAIEAPGSLSSFNLAQAVSIALWELSRVESAPPSTPPPAPRGELEALLDHACAALETIGYFRFQDREHKRVELRRLLGAAALDAGAVKGLHRICAQILRAVEQRPLA